jgi:hypothetical protein
VGLKGALTAALVIVITFELLRSDQSMTWRS